MTIRKKRDLYSSGSVVMDMRPFFAAKLNVLIRLVMALAPRVCFAQKKSKMTNR